MNCVRAALTAARHRDLGPDGHARHADRSRKARNARRQMEALGSDVIMARRDENS